MLKIASFFDLSVSDAPLIANNGLIEGTKIALRDTLDSDTERCCVLAEEIGHYVTTIGNIKAQSTLDERKQELKARRFGHSLLVTVPQLYEAQAAGCRDFWEVAEYIGVTEEYLREALDSIERMHGTDFDLDGYHVSFYPLTIAKL